MVSVTFAAVPSMGTEYKQHLIIEGEEGKGREGKGKGVEVWRGAQKGEF